MDGTGDGEDQRQELTAASGGAGLPREIRRDVRRNGHCGGPGPGIRWDKQAVASAALKGR